MAKSSRHFVYLNIYKVGFQDDEMAYWEGIW